MYTDKQQKVIDYLHAVMEGEIHDQNIVVTKDGDGYQTADIKETIADVKDRNQAAKILAEVYDLLDTNPNVNVNLSDPRKLYDDLIAAREAVERKNAPDNSTG